MLKGGKRPPPSIELALHAEGRKSKFSTAHLVSSSQLCISAIRRRYKNWVSKSQQYIKPRSYLIMMDTEIILPYGDALLKAKIPTKNITRILETQDVKGIDHEREAVIIFINTIAKGGTIYWSSQTIDYSFPFIIDSLHILRF